MQRWIVGLRTVDGLALEQALPLRQLAQAQLHRARPDRTVATGKDRSIAGRLLRVAPRSQCRARMRSHRHAALLATLAEHGHQAVDEIQVMPAQSAQLRQAQP